MTKFVAVSILSLCLLVLNLYHAIYISVTEVNYDVKTNKWQISVKVFTNDLEDAIYNQTSQSLSLRTAQELNNGKDLINSYINDRLRIKFNGRQVRPQISHAENEGDATWCYFVVDSVGVGDIEVQNQILTELFATQSNVVTINVEGEKRYLRFAKSSEPVSVSF